MGFWQFATGGGSGGGSGDVVGPASATDNAIARFDGTTGKLIQNSGVTVADGLTGSVVVGSTGATDDAILVADGTGGSTLAATNVFIDSSSIFRLGGANSNNYPALRPKSDNSGTFEIVKAASPVSAWGNLSTEGGRVSASLISNASSAAASTVTIYGSGSLLQLGTGAGVAWTNNTSSESGSLDTGLSRIAAGQLAVKNATNGMANNIKIATATVTASGATSTATNLVPAGCILLGVTTRVTTAITSGDGGTSVNIGNGTDADMYGATIAFTLGTTTDLASHTASALAFKSAAESVVFTCNGGTFSGGVWRVCAHYLDLTAPTS